MSFSDPRAGSPLSHPFQRNTSRDFVLMDLKSRRICKVTHGCSSTITNNKYSAGMIEHSDFDPSNGFLQPGITYLDFLINPKRLELEWPGVPPRMTKSLPRGSRTVSYFQGVELPLIPPPPLFSHLFICTSYFSSLLPLRLCSPKCP